MALVTPEFLQTQTYNAMRDRLVLKHAAASQPGVTGSTDFKVAQRGGGANMTVDVAIGAALVGATNSGNKGFYHLEGTSITNVAIAAAHATLPRIDQVYLTVKDSTHGGDATDVPLVQVVTGTATSGAQISSVTGAGYRAGANVTVPANSIRLADVFVGAAVTSIVTANINDRRPWAYGAFFGRTTVATASTAVTHTTLQTIPNTGITLELSGAPIIATLTAPKPSVSPGWKAQMFLDATAFGSVNSAIIDGFTGQVSSLNFSSYHAAPAAGRHVISPFFASENSSSTTTLPTGVQFFVQELPAGFADNG